MSETTSRALEEVLTRFGRMLQAVGRRRGLAGADLDELVQDVRVRLWQALVQGEKIQRVKTSYVYRAALSASVDLIRRRRECADVLELDADGVGAVADPAIARDRPDTVLEQRELAEQIERAVGQLAEPRDVVVRLHLSGYDRFEIAEMLGWSEAKVRNLIYRGLADLRGILTHEQAGQVRPM